MKWYSVKDDLPEDDQDVLISDGSRCDVANYNSSSDMWYGSSIIQYQIFYWMPLPKPPKD